MGVNHEAQRTGGGREEQKQKEGGKGGGGWENLVSCHCLSCFSEI